MSIWRWVADRLVPEEALRLPRARDRKVIRVRLNDGTWWWFEPWTRRPAA